jgi:hypothetical protein
MKKSTSRWLCSVRNRASRSTTAAATAPGAAAAAATAAASIADTSQCG